MVKLHRNIALFILCITMTFLWGCSSDLEYNIVNEDTNNTKIIDQINTMDTREESNEARLIVEDIIEQQLSAIRVHDIKSFIGTLDSTEAEYIAERKSWFRDIVINSIKDFNIRVVNASLVSEDTILAQLSQSYNFNGQSYSLSYDLKYIKKEDAWYDSGLNLMVEDTEHFQVKFPQGLEKDGQMAAKAAEEAYTNVVNRIGIEAPNKTIIKIYNDKETLRQLVKLSFSWQFAGWYEYPESIKTMTYNSKDEYRDVIEHELTHKITISQGNNNLPYWFSEGLAMYFTDYYNKDLKSLYKENLSTIFSIGKLEKLNLETMTDNREISYYYVSSGIVVSFMAKEFGEDKLIEIIQNLGQYSYLEGTAAEIDPIAVDRFRQTIPSVLGITVEELDNIFQAWLNE